MRVQWGRSIAFVITALVLSGLCLTEAAAQRRRTKQPRRVTNPVAAAPAPSPAAPTNEPRIISTAEEAANESTAPTPNGRRANSRRTAAPEAEEDSVRQQVDRLSTQFNSLNEKLTQMESQQRTLVDMERLTRAETRAETLRAQLLTVMEKEAELQTRAEQIDYELQPTIIERTLAASGSTRPEELRELRRRQLESEKTRVQTQLGQLAASRGRLETAIANADAEADRIRTRIDTALAPPAATDGTEPGTPTTTSTYNPTAPPPPETGESEPR